MEDEETAGINYSPKTQATADITNSQKYISDSEKMSKL